MKLQQTLLIGVFIFAIFSSVTLALSSEGHPGENSQTTDQCDNPTETLTIIAYQDDDAIEDRGMSFDKAEYKVTKGTCYEITFKNPNTVLHDFVIDEDDQNDFHGIHVNIENETAIDNSDSYTANILFPNTDITYKLYCSVAGHDTAGMNAILTVGNGTTTSPGFEFITIFGILSTIGIISVLHKKRKD